MHYSFYFIMDSHGLYASYRVKISLFSAGREGLMLFFEKPHALLHEDVLPLVIGEGI